jgi:histidinol dehydrogenase
MLRIITQQAEAQTELRRISDRNQDDAIQATEAAVREIVETVKQQGNQALLGYANALEQPTLNIQQFRVSGSELDAAYQQISKELLNAIQLACKKIEAFHRQRIPKSWVQFEEDGVVLGKRYMPVERVGLHIPGGSIPYPSTVLMYAIPAKVANVPQIVMVTPPGPDQKIHPAILVAAQEARVGEIYRIGGAQAIAALAYGTETIPKVDVIAGPGDNYVTLAKRAVYGTVGIDSLVGSSDLLIIADGEATPSQVAADMLAQAEQDSMASTILITTDSHLAKIVQQEVQHQLKTHPRRILTEKAIAHYGLIVLVDSLEEAAHLSNYFAPEHLALAVTDPWSMLEQIHHAGVILLGNATPKVVGDYLGGSTSILRTSGAARYASALGVETFMKHSTLIQYSPLALKKMSGTIQTLAQAEGFLSSVDSIRLRIQGKKPDE